MKNQTRPEIEPEIREGYKIKSKCCNDSLIRINSKEDGSATRCVRCGERCEIVLLEQ